MPRVRHTFDRSLGSAETPVFLVTAERKLLLFNAGCERLTGWGAADVVGKVCHYASTAGHSTADAITSSLCPPPEVFEGQEASVATYLVHRNGQSLPRMLHFFPLRDARNKVTSVLGIVTPIKQPARTTSVSPTQQVHAELAALRGTLRARFGEQTLVCRSPAMAKVLNQLDLARQSRAFVFLEGEAGTGKEHFARVIHYSSPQRANWFVPLDCRRLDADELGRILGRLLELHLSTPAGGARPQPGTLYLADVEHLPRDLQEQIARAFAEHKGEPALRLMASGTRSLKAAVAADAVRHDLFVLLTTLTIELPPLRERLEDLPVLAQHFLEEANRQSPRQIGGFAEEIWPLFTRYAWPGNLDELNLVVREAFSKCTESVIRPADLPFRFRTAADASELPPAVEPPSLLLDPLLTRVETNLIQLALERSRYNKSKAAELLGVNRARLYRRMEQLGIEDREAE